jgi:hypothetical protein
MIELTTWRTEEFEFQDEKILMELKPLTNESYIELSPYIDSEGDEGSDGEKSVKLFKTVVGVKETLKKHVKNIGGISIDGEVLTVDELCNMPMLLSLASEVINRLCEISSFSREDEKNSDGE